MSDENFYEEIYEDCQEILNPHIKPQHHGGCTITKDSLIPSVIESLEYLVEFWLANKDKEGVDLCGAKA
jgi:hypothetical protein